MAMTLDIVKGIHPGLILERELKRRKITQGKFALSIQEYPQTLSAIIKGKRSMNTHLALRVEEALGWDEGFLMTLQVFYDIREIKRTFQQQQHPDILKFRPALFWDTKINDIDWNKQKRSIINRVFERGSFTEKKEVLNYYGSAVVKKVLATEKQINGK